MEGTANGAGADDFEEAGEAAMTLLHPGRVQRPQAVGVAGCGRPAEDFLFLLGLKKKHLFCEPFVVQNSKFAAQRRRNNFLFARAVRYIYRK